MYRYYYTKSADKRLRIAAQSAGVTAPEEISGVVLSGSQAEEICIKSTVQLTDEQRQGIDYNLASFGYVFSRLLANRKPRSLSDLVTAVDSFLDTNAKLKQAVVRLVALYIQEKQPGDHGFGNIDGTEPE